MFFSLNFDGQKNESFCEKFRQQPETKINTQK